MSPKQRAVARKQILDILDSSGGYLMPVETLLDHLNLVARPPLSLTELDDVLKRMTADHQIKDVTGGDEIRKIGITDEGQAARM